MDIREEKCKNNNTKKINFSQKKENTVNSLFRSRTFFM